MPHIILEHSNNVKEQTDYKEFFNSAVNKMIDLGIVADSSSIKCRFIKPTEYFLSDPENIFIHLQISLLAGRDRDRLQALSREMKELLQNNFKQSLASHPDSFSVEIREMDKDLYSK